MTSLPMSSATSRESHVFPDPVGPYITMTPVGCSCTNSRMCACVRLSMESAFDIVDIEIDILDKTYQYTHNRYTDKESYETKKVFRKKQYHKSYKNRKVYICRDNLGIEIVCLNCMNNKHHDDTCYHNTPPTEPISDDDDRDARDKSSKYRHKSKYKYHQRYRDDVWECSSL